MVSWVCLQCVAFPDHAHLHVDSTSNHLKDGSNVFCIAFDEVWKFMPYFYDK